MHIAAIVANFLSRFMTGSQLENESRSWEMLAAGCAVGVACTFSAPVGGLSDYFTKKSVVFFKGQVYCSINTWTIFQGSYSISVRKNYSCLIFLLSTFA